MKDAVGTVTITIQFVGDIDGRGGQNESVQITGIGTISLIDIGVLQFENGGGSVCGLGLGFFCCAIEQSFEVDGAVVNDFSSLRFKASTDVFPYVDCANKFTTTVEYCSLNLDPVFL